MLQIKNVFISVAEASADLHAATLLRRARTLLPDVRFHGLTGPRTRAAGAETVFDFTAHAAMLAGVFSVIRHARAALRAVAASWEQRRPDLVLLLDSPELHLRIARRARRAGIPVLYYIAPQTWASRAYRNPRIARDVDRLACILPFEEPYFRRRGVRAEFVGHPLFEALAEQRPDPARVARLRAGGDPVIALLPGSRRHVIDSMLPHQLAAVQHMQELGLGVQIAISCQSAERLSQIEQHVTAAGLRPEVMPAEESPPADEAQAPAPREPALRQSAPPRAEQHRAVDPGHLQKPKNNTAAGAAAHILVADNPSLLTAADLVLVASGTATLEVAHYRKPMIVLYDAGLRWLLERPHRTLGRFVLTTPHLSLVNILAGRRIVPEFMPYVPRPEPIARVAEQLLADLPWLRLMQLQLAEITAPLANSQASTRVCELMAEMLANPRR